MGTFSIWHLIIVLTVILGIIWGVRAKIRKPKLDVEKELPIEPPEKSKSGKSNFITRYWKGDVSLPISYWVVSWCTSLLIIIIFLSVGSFLSTLKEFDPMSIFVSMSSGYLILTALIIWQTIGVLRSSLNHIKNPKKLKIWGYLAIFFILGSVLNNYNTYQNVIVPQLVSYYKIAILSDPDIPSYRITVVENGKELLIEGGIKHGLMKDVEKALILAPSITTINLDSMGGRQGEAKDLYNLISQRGLNTVTNKDCVSACTIVFAAGKNRWVGINGRLGFHSSSFEGLSEEDVNATNKNMYRRISKEKGIPVNFFLKGDKVASKDMWYPTIDELDKNNFITSHFSPAISSLRILEKTLTRNLNKTTSSLPKQLDSDTTLVDIRIKFNNVTSIHTLSRDLINRIQRAGVGWQFIEKHVIKTECKSEAIRRDIKIGIRYKYVYLHPKTNSNIVTFSLPKTCP
jgi:hypothetical protein